MKVSSIYLILTQSSSQAIYSHQQNYLQDERKPKVQISKRYAWQQGEKEKDVMDAMCTRINIEG